MKDIIKILVVMLTLALLTFLGGAVILSKQAVELQKERLELSICMQNAQAKFYSRDADDYLAIMDEMFEKGYTSEEVEAEMESIIGEEADEFWADYDACLAR